MIDAISKLVESGAISEDVQKGIQEAWDLKIKENKEQVGAELREEFANCRRKLGRTGRKKPKGESVTKSR